MGIRVSSREISDRNCLQKLTDYQTTAMTMFPIVSAPIKAQMLEETFSFLRLVKARAKIVRRNVNFIPIFALSGKGHFMRSVSWSG